MLNKLLKQIRQYEMLRPGDRVVCAVSGGADSVALLFGMYLLREKLDITLEAAHFNHQLRGEESDRDEEFVRQFCDRYDIPLTVGRGQVVSGKKGLEAAARDARYGFLKGFDARIATAHTADDNAETVLMHLVRGTGLRGLGGITPVNGNVIRPMLTVTRQEVLAFLEEYCLQYVEDSSNGTDEFLRNRLRHRVMPVLKEENPRLAENLSEMAMQLRLDAEALESQAPMRDVPALLQMHPAIRSRAVHRFLVQAGVSEPERSHVRAVEALICSINPSAQANLPGGITVAREYDRLVVLPAQDEPSEAVLQPGESLELPQWGVRVSYMQAEEIINTKEIFTVNAAGTVLLRTRRAGDAIRLNAGTCTLKKLFIDRKIPAHQRAFVPVLADEQGVLGVMGIGANVDRLATALPAMQIRLEKIK